MKGQVSVEVPDEDYWRRQIRCQAACPVQTDARGYVRAIADGSFEDAYRIARGPNPMASVCGRVCGAPCESSCRRGFVDQPIAIRALKRFVTESGGTPRAAFSSRQDLVERLRLPGRECLGPEELLTAPASASGKRVAIIGSGPAGLAAAHDLALLGYAPTVYEMEPVPAGMLAVGIPRYRLPRAVLAAEVDTIRNLGVEFVCDTQVGVDLPLSEIRREFSATIIAVGAKRSRMLRLPGVDGPGVVGGVEFLRDVALDNHAFGSTLEQVGERIVVIGGGNVAYDVSRTVVRQTGFDVSRSALRLPTRPGGPAHVVHLCCLESIDEMPADDTEIIEGEEEGVQLHPSLGPIAIERAVDGWVRGVTFQRCTRVFDEEGRFAPEFDASKVTTIDADTVIFAIGQGLDLSFLDPEGDIEVDSHGHVVWDPGTQHTSAPDVFIAGDVAYGPRLLINAVASGKSCARSVHDWLSDEGLSGRTESRHRPIQGYGREEGYEKLDRTVIPTSDIDDRRQSDTAIVEMGFDQDEALREASRCLDCGVNPIFDSERCILCGACADICPELCLQVLSADRLVGDDAVVGLLRGLAESEDLSGLSAIVMDQEHCIRCGLCAQRCPVDAISMERFEFHTRWAPADPTSET